MGHEDLDALCIDVIRASNEVFLGQCRHLIGQALPVQVLFTVVSLVLYQVVGHHNVLKAHLLACSVLAGDFLIAFVQTVVVVRLNHLLCAQVNLLKLISIECLVHFVCVFALDY